MEIKQTYPLDDSMYILPIIISIFLVKAYFLVQNS